MYLILVGLWYEDFSKSLAKKTIDSLMKVLARLAKFINDEEVEHAKQQVERPNNPLRIPKGGKDFK